MPRLIINADDLGINAQRSHGIFQCAEFGVVTSATIIPNGSDSDNAARHAHERGLPSGLHLNLTEEYPISRPEHVATLIDTNGIFLGKKQLMNMLQEGQIVKEHLEREVRAQVEWIFDTYGAPTHVDSHHHIHIHPTIANVLIPILERYGIRFVRIPREEPLPPFGYEITDEELAHARTLSSQAREVQELYVAHGILSTDHFRGTTLAGRASLKNMRHIISRLPEGTTELMVHPGSSITYGTPFDLGPQRQTELRMLTDASTIEALQEKKVELCSYADL